MSCLFLVVQREAVGCNNNSGNPGKDDNGRLRSFHTFPLERPLWKRQAVARVRRRERACQPKLRLLSVHRSQYIRLPYEIFYCPMLAGHKATRETPNCRSNCRNVIVRETSTTTEHVIIASRHASQAFLTNHPQSAQLDNHYDNPRPFNTTLDRPNELHAIDRSIDVFTSRITSSGIDAYM